MCGLKGALDNFNIIPRFFFKKVEFIVALVGLSNEMNVCQLLLASSFPFQRYNNFAFIFYLSASPINTRLQNSAPSVVILDHNDQQKMRAIQTHQLDILKVL